MRDALTDLSTAVASSEEDFVSENYDLAKGPVCQKHASGRNTFVEIGDMPNAQVHPDFARMYSAWSGEAIVPDDAVDGEAEFEELIVYGDEKEFNDRYMHMFDRIVDDTVDTMIRYADTVTQYAVLVLNSSKPVTSFVCESYFSFRKNEDDEADDFDTAAPFEGWKRYSKVRRP